MNNTQIKIDLENFTENCIGIDIFFVDHEDKLHRSDIQNGDLDDARKEFTSALKRKYVANERFTIPFLSQHDDRNHALYKFDFDHKPLAFSLVDQALQLTPETKLNLDLYKAKNNKLSGIKAIVIVLKTRDGKKAAFYQHIFNVTILNSGKGVLNLTTHETRVVKLNNDILRVSPNFVFMKMGKQYLIENINALENQLNFKTVIHQRAEAYTEVLVNKCFSDDFNIFLEKAQEDTSFARKVVKVCKHSAVLEHSVTTKMLIEFVKKEEQYFSALKFSEDETKFDLNSINRCRKFLELLDDDFLRSPLTKESYLARAKDRLS